METKVIEKNQIRKLPAGLIEGVEAFWYNNEKWLIYNGTAMRFTEAPAKVQNMIANQFLKDFKSRTYLKRIGATSFAGSFDFWYRCVIGALDEKPDFVNGKFTADAYNHSCNDYKCVHRGRFCSLGPGLRNWEVETIVALKQGFTFEKTAQMLCITLAGLRSRIEKMKEKLDARNTTQLITKATELGI